MYETNKCKMHTKKVCQHKKNVYHNLVVSKSGNMSEQGRLSLSKFLINKPKAARFSKFKFIFALK